MWAKKNDTQEDLRGKIGHSAKRKNAIEVQRKEPRASVVRIIARYFDTGLSIRKQESGFVRPKGSEVTVRGLIVLSTGASVVHEERVSVSLTGKQKKMGDLLVNSSLASKAKPYNVC